MGFITNAEKLIPNIDLGFVASILGDVYGFNSPIYLPWNFKSEYEARGYTIPEQFLGYENLDLETPDRPSMFGTPIFGSFTIKGGKYLIFDKSKGTLVPKAIDDFEFPVTSIIEFRRPKVITKSPMIGGAGTVKEIYGLDDWAISIKGVCLNDPSRKDVETRTARSQQIKLCELNEIVGHLVIKSGSIFLNKKIFNIVMEDVIFSPIQGKPDVIPFEIPCCSDEDILLFENV